MEQKAVNNKIQTKVFEELCNIVGADNIFDSIEERVRYSSDATEEGAIPNIAVHLHSSKQVSSVLSIAHKYTIPVCPVAGAGISGYVRIKGGIVLDMKNMNRIIELNARDLTVTVEPGVVIKDLQEEAANHKLFYPPVPGSTGISTIGGSVAECTGGMMGMKYGVTRDYVLALQVVLPDGSVINTGRKALKSVAGYDLTRFFVGSEGTLGVITEITLKLLPLPEKRGAVMSCFKDIDDALNAADSILVRKHLRVCSLEFADRSCIDVVKETTERDVPEEAGAMLLIDVDGNEKNVEKDISRIKAICMENNALKTVIAVSDEERGILRNIWISIPLFKVASTGINEDFYVPGSKVRATLRKAYELSRLYPVRVAAFGNIGEGHIHLNVINNEGREVDLSFRDVVSQILKETVSAGGTVTSEYGTSNAKAGFIGLEPAPREIEIMKDLKKMFDPKGIMNSGKIFV